MTHSLPDGLRQQVENDLYPVRPVWSPLGRTLLVAAVAVGVAIFALTTIRLRLDLGQMPMWLSWGAAVVELLLGIVLVGASLREAVPGRALPRRCVRLLAVAAVVYQMAVGMVTWLHSHGVPVDGDGLALGMGCLKHDSTLALPAFLLTLWLIFRALPLRAPVAGLLGGGGAAIAADAISHMLCPYSDLRHVLVWHTGTIVLFMLAGWLVGALWERLRWR